MREHEGRRVVGGGVGGGGEKEGGGKEEDKGWGSNRRCGYSCRAVEL
jgi:hypothetical protein